MNPDSNGQCPTGFTYMNDYFGCIKQTYLGYTTSSQSYKENEEVSFTENPVIGYYFPYGGDYGQTCNPEVNSNVICFNASDIIPKPTDGYFEGVDYKKCNSGREYPTAYFRNSLTDFYWRYPATCPCSASNGKPDNNMCISNNCGDYAVLGSNTHYINYCLSTSLCESHGCKN